MSKLSSTRVLGNLIVDNNIYSTGSLSVGTISTSGQLLSTLVTGIAPFVITSTTPVENLGVRWANVADKPDPKITLAGDLSGSVTLTDLGSGTLTATIAPNSVALGTDTTGNYVATVSGITNGGLSISGSGSENSAVTIGHSNILGAAGSQSGSSGAIAFGGTILIPSISYDRNGHITSTTTTSVTLPGNPNTDTKNTAGATDTSAKIFLVGATAQTANPQTYTDNEVFVTNGKLDAREISTSGNATIGGSLTVTGNIITNNVEMIETSNGIIFEGTTKDGFETTLYAIDPTADRTITLPNASGTVALTGNIGNATITIAAGGGLTTGGAFTTNQSSNETITITHDDTSTLSGSYGTDGIKSITVDGLGHVTAVTTENYVSHTEITNYSINPNFGTSIGMGNDSAVLYFNDSTNETRTDYWTSKDGFEVRGDSNSMDSVVLKSGNLQINTNAHIGNKVSAKEHVIQSDTGTDSATMKYDSTSKTIKFTFA